jgi:hypothetical protein
MHETPRTQSYGTHLRAFFVGTGASALARARELQFRLQRTTTRERVLLGGLVVSALVYGPLVVFEWRNTQQDRYVAGLDAQSTARLQQSASRRIYSGAPDQVAIDDMRSWGFEASNVAVAQVLIERRLVQSAAAAGLTNVRITTDSEPEIIGPTQWLGAEIQADLVWSPTFAFLDDLTAWPEGFRVRQFQYQTASGPTLGLQPQNLLATGRVTIDVAVPVSIANAAS